MTNPPWLLCDLDLLEQRYSNSRLSLAIPDVAGVGLGIGKFSDLKQTLRSPGLKIWCSALMIGSIEGIPLEDIYNCTLFSYDDHMILYLARILLCLQGGTISRDGSV